MARSPSKVGLIFDDGFRGSSIRTAELFEQFKLAAVFAVLADRTDFAPRFDIGDFGLWNELQGRGHVVYPHGFMHFNLSELPHEQAIEQVKRCLAAFAEKLDGFDPKRAIYAHTYNCGTPRLNEFLLPRVAGVRQNGSGFITDADLQSRVLHSSTFGPGDPGDDLLELLGRCATFKPAAFLYSLHGLDGEAWGTIAGDTLRRVLEMITTNDAFQYWVPGR